MISSSLATPMSPHSDQGDYVNLERSEDIPAPQNRTPHSPFFLFYAASAIENSEIPRPPQRPLVRAEVYSPRLFGTVEISFMPALSEI